MDAVHPMLILFLYLVRTHVCTAHSDSVWSVAWSKSDKHDNIITSSVDGTVKSWKW